jgi:TBC1 domain family member 4
MTKVMGATKSDSSLSEQNQFLMILLRAYSENRQMKHVHDTLENRSEFLNQYLGGTSIFKKAKRSLSNSFDLLNSLNSLKRKSIHGKDDTTIQSSGGEETSNCDNNSIKNENHLVLPLRSNSFGHYTNNNSSATPVPLKSPMMDIFIKSKKMNKEFRYNYRFCNIFLNF